MLLTNTGVNLYNFLKEANRRELLEKELSIAKTIQEGFLPAPLEKFEGLELDAQMVTAKHVGGDLYDIFPLGKDKLGILIGDVSGKGVPAALIMAKTISLFRAMADKCSRPAQLLFQLNEEMVKQSNPGIFVTAVYAIYDSRTRNISLASAGHCDILVYKKSTQKIETFAPKDGLPLGLASPVEFSQEEMRLEKGDCIVFYTDGVIEARNLSREEFGSESLTLLILKTPFASAKDLSERIFKALRQHVGKAPQHDDCTIIILRQA